MPETLVGGRGPLPYRQPASNPSWHRLLLGLGPVLDVYAENDRDAQFAEYRKAWVSDRFVQDRGHEARPVTQ